MVNTDGSFHVDFIQNVDKEATNISVDSNYIYSSTPLQICLLKATGKFVNNVFSGTSAAFINTSSSISFYNNTFYQVTTDNNAILTYGSSTFRIKNNLFIGCGGDNNTYGWYGKGDSGTPTMDVDYNYVTKTSAASYGAKSGFSETNGVTSGNPLFVTEGSNWSLQGGSPAKDAGVDLSGVWASALDRAGVSRPQGAAWDIGAYEYDPGQKISLGAGGTITFGAGGTITLGN
jgi:hypothetical protein